MGRRGWGVVVKIFVPLDATDACVNMTRIRNVILAGGTVPKAVFAWMDHARAPVYLDADMQKIFGIVDAALSVLRAKQHGEGYDFDAALARVNAICKSRIGEVN